MNVPGSQEGVTVIESVACLARLHIARCVQDLELLTIEPTRISARGSSGEGERTTTWPELSNDSVGVSVPSATGITKSVDQHNRQPFIHMRHQQMMARPITGSPQTGQTQPAPALPHTRPPLTRTHEATRLPDPANLTDAPPRALRQESAHVTASRPTPSLHSPSKGMDRGNQCVAGRTLRLGV